MRCGACSCRSSVNSPAIQAQEHAKAEFLKRANRVADCKLRRRENCERRVRWTIMANCLRSRNGVTGFAQWSESPHS